MEVRTEPKVIDYRDAIKKMLDSELQNALEAEMRKAAQELMDEQRKAIKQILEEHRAAIRQVVEEEKKAIWEKAEALRQSILKLGL